MEALNSWLALTLAKISVRLVVTGGLDETQQHGAKNQRYAVGVKAPTRLPLRRAGGAALAAKAAIHSGAAYTQRTGGFQHTAA